MVSHFTSCVFLYVQYNISKVLVKQVFLKLETFGMGSKITDNKTHRVKTKVVLRIIIQKKLCGG